MTITAAIGPVLLDEVVTLPHFPDEDSTLAISSTARAVGGAMPTRSKVQRALGWTCRLLATVGDDQSGTNIRQDLDAAGIDTRWLITARGRQSAFAHVWLSSASKTRTIAYSTGTLDPISSEALPADFLANVDVLQLDGREPHAGLAAATIARSRGMAISCDLGNHPDPGRLALIAGASLVQVSARFAREFAPTSSLQQVARLLSDRGADVVVVTDGPRGSWYASADEEGHTPAFRVPDAASLGAGDTFGAALTFSLVEHRTARSISEMMIFATAAAAMHCAGRPHDEFTESEIRVFAAATERARD